MSHMVGADVAELRQLASTFNARAAQLKSIESQLNWRIHSAPWEGHDVSRFVNDWNTRHRRVITSAAASITNAAQELLANADQQEQASTALGGSGSSGISGRRSSAQLQQYVRTHPLKLDHDPAMAAAQWAALDPALRAAYIQFAPKDVGSTNGLPAADRSAANQLVLRGDVEHYGPKVQEDLDVLTAELGRLRSTWSRLPMPGDVFNAEVGGFISIEESLRLSRMHATVHADELILHNANAVQQKMSHAHDMNTDAYLLIYQPNAFGGDGRAAIAFGDPDHAVNTAVIVPGLNSTVQSEYSKNTDAENLYREMSRTGSGQSTSVIAYMGYDSPELEIDRLNASVASEGRARDGAVLLISDVAGLRASHDPSAPSHLTLIGHSYGSTTVSDAAVGAAKADDYVLIGSPGMDHAKSAESFGGQGHLFVGAASTDPVSSAPAFNQLGFDPAQEGSGAIRFHAESVDRNDNPIEMARGYFQDHSRYFELDGSGPGFRASESLANIASISNGTGIPPDEAASLRVSDGYGDTEQAHVPHWIDAPGVQTDVRPNLPSDRMNSLS